MPRFSSGALDHGRRVHRCAEPGRRRHGHRPQRPGQGAGPGASDQRSQAQERDHVPRRRHGRFGDHRRALLLAGAGGHLRMDALPVHRRADDLVGQAGHRPDVPARLRARLGRHRHRMVDRQEDHRRAHLAGPEHAVNVPGQQRYRPSSSSPRSAGMATGNVSTAEITDATPAVLASHISQRGCQGPDDTRTTCPHETKAAGGLGSIAEQEVDHQVDVILGGGKARYDQTLDGGPTGRRSTQYAQARRATASSSNAAGLAARQRRQASRSSASSTPATCRSSGTARRAAPAGRRRLRPAGDLRRPNQRPATEPAPGRHDDQGDLAAQSTGSAGNGLLPAGRGRVDRQAATTPRTRASRSARRSPSTRRSASRSTRSARTPTP